MATETDATHEDFGVLAPEKSLDSDILKMVAVFSVGLTVDFILGAYFTADPINFQQFWYQDIWLIAVIFCLVSFSLIGIKAQRLTGQLALLDVRLIAVAIFVICFLGHRWLLLGYDLSRDEQMANFDAMIYAHGHLAWPLPQEWEANASPLNLLFISPGTKAAWVSAYLPMNAAIRALMGWLGSIDLTGPLLNASSLLLLWSCARRLWPQDRETSVVSLLLLALSGQFIFAGMTAFAMPAHLFFNLLWLRLFLTDRRFADVAAIIAGFVATGLHQPLFHPLFVAPFLFLLLRERRWSRLLLFLTGYAAIAVFWLAWPQIAQTFGSSAHAGGSTPAAATAVTASTGIAHYLSMLTTTLSRNDGYVIYMSENLLRFVTWQHVLMLPLLIASWNVARTDRLVGAIGLGFLLPILVMALILPWQGNGFGYRYVHGVLGNAALLGGYGWQRLAALWRTQLRVVFRRTTVASAFVLLPIQAWMAHDYYAPSARASAKIDASGADYAIIGTDDYHTTSDLVLNRPDLSNRPIRLLAHEIGDIDGISYRICRSGVRVALSTEQFLQPVIAHYSPMTFVDARKQMPLIKASLERGGCQIVALQ